MFATCLFGVWRCFVKVGDLVQYIVWREYGLFVVVELWPTGEWVKILSFRDQKVTAEMVSSLEIVNEGI